MSLERSRSDIVNAVIIALTALAGVALWTQLPAAVAIHFSASGTPDNYVSKPVGVALMPSLMFVTLLVLKGAFRFDPPESPKVAATVTVATISFMSAIHGLVLAWNLGHPVPFDLVLVGSLLWAILLVVYANTVS